MNCMQLIYNEPILYPYQSNFILLYSDVQNWNSMLLVLPLEIDYTIQNSIFYLIGIAF